MTTVAIVQARMGSTRLPGKVLMDLGGTTMLARVVRRTRRARRLDSLLVATTTAPADDAIVRECERLGAPVFRGSEDDVLDRYYCAAQAAAADRVVRITSDCPLIDAEVIDAVIARLAETQADYASNALPRSFPRGLDVEAMTAPALARAWREARQSFERAHVTPYLYGHPESFRLAGITAESDYSSLRWTVDTTEDLAVVRALYARLGNTDEFGWRAALELVRRDPALAQGNRAVRQKELGEG